jgi:cytochrome P450
MTALPDRAAAFAFRLTDPPSGFAADPYPWYAALRSHDPLHEMAPGVLLVTRYADVAAVYRSNAVSSDKRREFGPKFGFGTPLYEHHTTSLVFNDPPLHSRVRRLLMGAMNQRAIARMEAGVVRLVEGLLDEIEARAPVADLIDDFAARIPVEVIGNLLAIPQGDRGPLRAWSLAILSALEPAPDAALLARGNAAVHAFAEYLDGLISERHSHPGNAELDVLTRLIQGEGSGERLTRSELLHNCIFLLNAGHETTTNLIGNGMHALLLQRGEYRRLQADPALLSTAIEELLRFESPLQLNNRLTIAPLGLGGRELEPGTFLTLAIGAANRDPCQFNAPDRLDITRKPNLHLAFGHGAHACAGMNVARLEARIAVAALARRWPKLELAGAPERDGRLRFRGLRRLPVRWG